MKLDPKALVKDQKVDREVIKPVKADIGGKLCGFLAKGGTILNIIGHSCKTIAEIQVK